jgi:CRISPR-associated protein Csm1
LSANRHPLAIGALLYNVGLVEAPPLATELRGIVEFADQIASGSDSPAKAPDWQVGSELKLHKIFNCLNKHADNNTVEHGDIAMLASRLQSGLAALPGETCEGIDVLLSLLEETTSVLPASEALSDVSVFDLAKTRAAIAVALLDWQAANGNALPSAGDPAFLLYSCDMSGIQKFIYNISGGGALKQLRARSFYLEMMLEHIVDELLGRLDLSRANLLYTGGGHAYMLLPNTPTATEAIAQLREELGAWFLANFKTDLYLASAAVECSADDLSNSGTDRQRYRNLYRSLSQRLSADKASRYDAATLAALNFDSPVGADHSRECIECHRSDTNITDGRCEFCDSLGKVSASLIRKDVFVVTTTPPDSRPSLPMPFGGWLQACSLDEYLTNTPVATRTYVKNSFPAGLEFATHIWMGDYTVDMGDAGIAAYASNGATLNGDKGMSRLGVLRADVDNLGAVFTNGLPDDKASISRTSALSHALSNFFKHEVNEILIAGGYQAQIIYSGGDDLFIIGNWSDVIYAAIDIRSALDEFTGNGSLTISVGVGMFDDKYPIANMAAETGELEDAAKRYPADANQPTKNAISLWSSAAVFSWGEFINSVQPKLAEVHSAFDSNDKGKAFIYRLIRLLRNTGDAISAPRLAYLLARSFENDDATSHRFYDWAQDADERRFLITALEWYVYNIRERG